MENLWLLDEGHLQVLLTDTHLVEKPKGVTEALTSLKTFARSKVFHRNTVLLDVHQIYNRKDRYYINRTFISPFYPRHLPLVAKPQRDHV